MMAFGAVILATVQWSAASVLERQARVPSKISVGVALLMVVFMMAALTLLVGEPSAEQFEILRQRLPAALDPFVQ